MPLLVFVVFSVMAAFAVLLPTIMFFLQNLGASKAEATQIVACYSLMQFAAGPFLGRLSDRFGRKNILLLGLTGGIVSYGLLVFTATSLPVVVALLMLAGVCAGTVPVIFAAASDISSTEKRSASLGFLGAGIGAAFTLGPAFGAYLGHADPDRVTLQLPATGSVTLIVVSFFLILLGKFPQNTLQSEEAIKRGYRSLSVSIPAFFRALATYPVLLCLAAMIFLFTFSVAVNETVYPYLVQERFDWGPREMGRLMAYGGLVVILVQGGLVGRLSKKFGDQPLIVTGAFLAGAGYLTIMMVPNTWGMVLALTLTGTGGSLFNTSSLSLGSKQAGDYGRGLILGSLQSMQSLGRSMAPLLSGLLFQSWMLMPLMVGVCLSLLICVIFFILKRRLVVSNS